MTIKKIGQRRVCDNEVNLCFVVPTTPRDVMDKVCSIQGVKIQDGIIVTYYRSYNGWRRVLESLESTTGTRWNCDCRQCPGKPYLEMSFWPMALTPKQTSA